MVVAVVGVGVVLVGVGGRLVGVHVPMADTGGDELAVLVVVVAVVVAVLVVVDESLVVVLVLVAGSDDAQHTEAGQRQRDHRPTRQWSWRWWASG